MGKIEKDIVYSYADIAHSYAAGLLDGEGYIGIPPKKNRRPGTPTIVVEMTSHAVLKFLQDLFEVGSIHKCKKRQPHHRQSWRWSTRYRKAYDIAQKIYPYTVLKKDKVYCILSYYKNKS